MRILITGHKGQLGQECTQVLKDANELMCTDYDELDITDYSQVERHVYDFKPDLIINCAAYTRVDDCENHQEQAFKLNVDGPENLARASESCGCRLVHISTDYVFDGNKPQNQFYTEEDIANPISYYGKTKFKGEQIVRETTSNHIIIRTAWLYSVYGNNFLKTILRLASNQEKQIKVVNDQYGSPTWAYRVALQIELLMNKKITGTFHATSEGYCSWFDLASYFLESMNIPHKLVPCSTQEYPTLAKRPKNSILENKKLKDIGLNTMGYWKDDIDIFVERFGNELVNV